MSEQSKHVNAVIEFVHIIADFGLFYGRNCSLTGVHCILYYSTYVWISKHLSLLFPGWQRWFSLCSFSCSVMDWTTSVSATMNWWCFQTFFLTGHIPARDLGITTHIISLNADTLSRVSSTRARKALGQIISREGICAGEHIYNPSSIKTTPIALKESAMDEVSETHKTCASARECSECTLLKALREMVNVKFSFKLSTFMWLLLARSLETAVYLFTMRHKLTLNHTDMVGPADLARGHTK